MGSRKMTRNRRARFRASAEHKDSRRQAYRRVDKNNEKTKSAWTEETRNKYDHISRRIIEGLFDGWQKFEKINLPNGLERLQSTIWYSPNANFREKFRKLLMTIVDCSPDLIDRRYFPILENLTRHNWIRPLGDWKVRGKSENARLRSLIDHLVVRYPVPEFLYKLLGFDQCNWSSMTFFISVASGARVVNSFNGYCLEIPMTRRMCHNFMQMPADTPFFAAVRNAQVKALGGDRELARAISSTSLGRGVREDEVFWLAVIRWFCEQPDIERSQVGPLIDYIENSRTVDPAYSMKGRTVRSLTRGMEEWHRQLALEKKFHGLIFTPSGINEGIWELEARHDNSGKKIIWTIEEVLTSKVLHAEGKAMKHCVYMYVSDIQKGYCSIWSLKYDGIRALTVEVLAESRTIVQARGKCNRPPKRYELNILKRWAQENGLRDVT